MSKAKTVQCFFLGVPPTWLFKTSLKPLSFYRTSLNLKPSWGLSWSHPALQCSQWGITQAATCQLLSACMTLLPPQTPNLTLGWDNSRGTPQTLKLIVSQSGPAALLLLCSSISCPLLSACTWDLLSSEASLQSRPQAQPEPQASNRSCSISSECSAPLTAATLPWQPCPAPLLLGVLDHWLPASPLALLLSLPDAPLGLWKNQPWFGFEYNHNVLLQDNSWRI